MILIKALRRLRRMRALVVVALVLACLAGIAIPYQIPSLKSRQYDVGVASVSALIDTAKSQVADLGSSTGSDVGTLAARASLLASLMATGQIKDDIANRAGVPAGELSATPPATVGAPASPAPSVPDSSISQSNPQAKILNVSVPNLQAGLVPIIIVGTQAPTAALAARIANASIAALVADVNSVAATDQVPDPQRLVVRQLGPAISSVVTRGPGVAYGVVGAIAAFLLLCGGMLAVSSLTAAARGDSSLADFESIYPSEPLQLPGPAAEHEIRDASISRTQDPSNGVPFEVARAMNDTAFSAAPPHSNAPHSVPDESDIVASRFEAATGGAVTGGIITSLRTRERLRRFGRR